MIPKEASNSKIQKEVNQIELSKENFSRSIISCRGSALLGLNERLHR